MYFKFIRPINHALAMGAYPTNATHVWFVVKTDNPAEILADCDKGTVCTMCEKPASWREESGLIFA